MSLCCGKNYERALYQPVSILALPWWFSGKESTCQAGESESEVVQSCLTVCDPMDCSLPGPSVYGIFQARVLEWVAIHGFSS